MIRYLILIFFLLFSILNKAALSQELRLTSLAAAVIKKAELNGSKVKTLVQNLENGPKVSSPLELRVDSINGLMFWTDFNNGTLHSAKIDGSDHKILLNGLVNPAGLALDTDQQKIFYGFGAAGFGQPRSIGKINYFGEADSGFTIIDNQGTELGPFDGGMDTDLEGGKLYFSTPNNFSLPKGAISRANLDGSAVEMLVTGADANLPQRVRLDLANKKIYWTTGQDIRRSNLDGSKVQILYKLPDILETGNPCCATGLALDVGGNKVYFGEPGVEINTLRLSQMTLDGKKHKTVIVGTIGKDAFEGLDYHGPSFVTPDTVLKKAPQTTIDGNTVVFTVTEYRGAIIPGTKNNQFLEAKNKKDKKKKKKKKKKKANKKKKKKKNKNSGKNKDSSALTIRYRGRILDNVSGAVVQQAVSASASFAIGAVSAGDYNVDFQVLLVKNVKKSKKKQEKFTLVGETAASPKASIKITP